MSIHPEAKIRLAASLTVPAVLLDGERRVKGITRIVIEPVSQGRV
jgi:hypothetical protein